MTACAALGVLPGCGGDDGGGGSHAKKSGAAPAAAAKPSVKVNIASFKFVPDPIRVKAGGTVTWANRDKAPHTAQTESSAKGAFETGKLELADHKGVKFDNPGRFQYFCIYHRFMSGTVEVVR